MKQGKQKEKELTMSDKTILKLTAIVGGVAVFYKSIDVLHTASNDTLTILGIIMFCPIIMLSFVGAIILGMRYAK